MSEVRVQDVHYTHSQNTQGEAEESLALDGIHIQQRVALPPLHPHTPEEPPPYIADAGCGGVSADNRNTYSGEPPTYEECQQDESSPPSYESLFGRVREAKKNSSTFLDFAVNFFLLILGTAGCAVMISLTMIVSLCMIVIGSLKIDQCPAERFVPIYLVVGGSFGLLENLISFSNRVQARMLEESRQENIPWHKRMKLNTFVNFFLTAWFITGCVWVYRIYEPNYTDPKSPYYYDYTLYMFAFWLVTSVYVSVAFVVSCMCCLSIFSLGIGKAINEGSS